MYIFIVMKSSHPDHLDSDVKIHKVFSKYCFAAKYLDSMRDVIRRGTVTEHFFLTVKGKYGNTWWSNQFSEENYQFKAFWIKRVKVSI